MFNQYFNANADKIDFMYANILLKNIKFATISIESIFNENFYNASIYDNKHTYYFFHIQSLLTACGNISNVFYNNSNAVATQRSKRLRNSLGICKSSFPLVFQKEVRNTNEHFDERYEQFYGRLGDYNLLSSDTDLDTKNEILTKPHLRTYDIANGIYYTYNKQSIRIEYDLRKLLIELRQMYFVISSNSITKSGWDDDENGPFREF